MVHHHGPKISKFLRKSRASHAQPANAPKLLGAGVAHISILHVLFLQIPSILPSEFVSRKFAAVYSHDLIHLKGRVLGDLMLMKTAAWICMKATWDKSFNTLFFQTEFNLLIIMGALFPYYVFPTFLLMWFVHFSFMPWFVFVLVNVCILLAQEGLG